MPRFLDAAFLVKKINAFESVAFIDGCALLSTKQIQDLLPLVHTEVFPPPGPQRPVGVFASDLAAPGSFNTSSTWFSGTARCATVSFNLLCSTGFSGRGAA
jgi:hypothetical protein